MKITTFWDVHKELQTSENVKEKWVYADFRLSDEKGLVKQKIPRTTVIDKRLSV